MKTQYVLVDVDTQRDFMMPDGALYVPAEDHVVDHIFRLTSLDLPRIGSVDSHAYDAWEFQKNGGPFPDHCVKGTYGWLKPNETMPKTTRFVAMGTGLVVGEDHEGTGNREYTPKACAAEIAQGVSIYFEKEVYSLFLNPMAEPTMAQLVQYYQEDQTEVVFVVYGYCTGGFCVDAAVEGLAERGYKVILLLDASAPLDAKGGLKQTTCPMMERLGIEAMTTSKFLELVS